MYSVDLCTLHASSLPTSYLLCASPQSRKTWPPVDRKHMASSWDPQVVRSFSGTKQVVKTADPCGLAALFFQGNARDRVPCLLKKTHCVFLVMKAQYFQVKAQESQLYLVLLLPLRAIFCSMDSVGLGHPESYASWSCEKTQKNRMFKFQTFRVVVPHIFLSLLSMSRLLVAPHLHPRGVYIQRRPTTFRAQLLSTRAVLCSLVPVGV